MRLIFAPFQTVPESSVVHREVLHEALTLLFADRQGGKNS
jgi:hypothetical protein